MAARGPYAKGVAKRREILDAALEIVDEHGYSNATVTTLAEAVGLSPNGLLHHFGSKAALFTAILRHVDEAGLAAMERGALRPQEQDFVTIMVELTRSQGRVPGYAELYLRLTAEAMDPAHPSHDYIASRFATERELVAPSFAALQAEGRVRPDADPAELAAMLYALFDGLQLRRAYEPDLDIPAHVQHFFDLIAPEREEKP